MLENIWMCNYDAPENLRLGCLSHSKKLQTKIEVNYYVSHYLTNQNNYKPHQVF